MNSVEESSGLPGDFTGLGPQSLFCSHFHLAFCPPDFYFAILHVWDVFMVAEVMGQAFLLRDINAEKLN